MKRPKTKPNIFRSFKVHQDIANEDWFTTFAVSPNWVRIGQNHKPNATSDDSVIGLDRKSMLLLIRMWNAVKAAKGEIQ